MYALSAVGCTGHYSNILYSGKGVSAMFVEVKPTSLIFVRRMVVFRLEEVLWMDAILL